MGAQLEGRIRGSHGRNKGHRPMSEINVTPFVDVMLVLLVVFMITAPLLTAGVKIDLPDSKAKALQKQDNTPIEVTINAKGQLFFGENKIQKAQLMENLRHIALKTSDQQVYVRADQNVDYGKAMEVMVMINQSGLSKIALISKSD